METGPERILVRVDGQFDDSNAIAAVNCASAAGSSTSPMWRRCAAAMKTPKELFRFDGKPRHRAADQHEGGRQHSGIRRAGGRADGQGRRRPLRWGSRWRNSPNQPHVVDEGRQPFRPRPDRGRGHRAAGQLCQPWLAGGAGGDHDHPAGAGDPFIFLDYLGITLQRISLGALIIALGLLVDDMIAIETMISRLELGETLTDAASYAWTSIAFPMLTGTLVTVAGFIPIGLNSSAAGEFHLLAVCGDRHFAAGQLGRRGAVRAAFWG